MKLSNTLHATHNSDWICLDENRLGEWCFAGTFLENRDTLSTKCLQDAPVIEALIVRITVDIG